MTTRKPASTPRKPASTPRKRPENSRRNSRKSALQAQKIKARLRLLAFRLLLLCAMGLLCYFVYIYLVSPYTSKWQAMYGKEVYPEGYSIHGIDISHHQGEIDWEKVRKARINDDEISFVIVKATEGKSFLDDNFNDNFYQAREYGFIRGAYHYFKPHIPAAEQARYFLKQVHLEEGDLPPVLDIEERGDLSTEQLRKAALKWLEQVEKRYHKAPIIYTNYKFKRDYLNTSDFDRYPYWIAHYYVRALSYKGPWKFWQHTDCGRINGIREKVDLNIYNGSMYDLKRLCLE